MPHSASPPSAAGSHLVVCTSSSAGAALISLDGELDLATAPALGQTVTALIADGARHLTFDMGHLTFVDPYGLRPVVAARRRLLEVGEPREPVQFRSPSSGLMALLTATHLDEVFPVDTAA